MLPLSIGLGLAILICRDAAQLSHCPLSADVGETGRRDTPVGAEANACRQFRA